FRCWEKAWVAPSFNHNGRPFSIEKYQFPFRFFDALRLAVACFNRGFTAGPHRLRDFQESDTLRSARTPHSDRPAFGAHPSFAGEFGSFDRYPQSWLEHATERRHGPCRISAVAGPGS